MGLPQKSIFKFQQKRDLFLHVFGTFSYQSLLLVCLTMLALSWCGDNLWLLLTDFGQECRSWQTWLGFLVFPATVVGWYILLEKSKKAMSNLIITESYKVPGCKVLIVFLSAPSADKEMIAGLLQDAKAIPENAIMDKAFREKFKSGWRMPLEAIAYHRKLGSLERVLVIPSKDSHIKQQDGSLKLNPGTFKLVQNFIELVGRGTAGKVQVHGVGEVSASWSSGVDYESVKELHDCFVELFSWLQDHGYNSPSDVVVDITSGQKVGSSVAMVMSLDLGRKVQYVSTNDYTLKFYDVTYETE